MGASQTSSLYDPLEQWFPNQSLVNVKSTLTDSTYVFSYEFKNENKWKKKLLLISTIKIQQCNRQNLSANKLEKHQQNLHQLTLRCNLEV